MAVVTVTGDPGCRAEETARLIARRLGYEWVAEFNLRRMLVEEYGSETQIPDRAQASALAALVARLAREHHLVLSVPGAESLVAAFSNTLRIRVTAPERFRIGTLLIEHNLDHASATRLLRHLESEQRAQRRRRFGRSAAREEEIDLTLNAESMDSDQAAQIAEFAARTRMLSESGLLASHIAAEVEFQARLKLARHGIAPPSKAPLAKKRFANESETIFANLLDFYRIAWEYEPRTFPLENDAAGNVVESFTPDFYLPELDLYVELTTMKQSLVTRKNRKVKRLRALYPKINIQVFYQRDFQNLVFKHGLADQHAAV